MNDLQIKALDKLDGSITSFKTFIQTQAINEIDEYFILEQPQVNENFQQNLKSLFSPETIPLTFLEDNHASVIAQTIDGDFIVANNQYTWVIDRSMYLEDSECFLVTINQWFTAYFQHQLLSSVLNLN